MTEAWRRSQAARPARVPVTSGRLLGLARGGTTKVVRCRDLGFDGKSVIHAESEEEALAQVAERAQTVHGPAAIYGEVVARGSLRHAR